MKRRYMHISSLLYLFQYIIYIFIKFCYILNAFINNNIAVLEYYIKKVNFLSNYYKDNLDFNYKLSMNILQLYY